MNIYNLKGGYDMYVRNFLYSLCVISASALLLSPATVSHAAAPDTPEEAPAENALQNSEESPETAVPDDTDVSLETPEESPDPSEENPPEENPDPSKETPSDEEESPEGEPFPDNDNPEPEGTPEPDFSEDIQLISLEDATIQLSADAETLFTKNFDDYTVTEGLLLLIFVVIFCKFCIDMTAKIMNWRMY